jgi:hypothetical protein
MMSDAYPEELEDIQRRVAELRRLAAKKPLNLRRLYHLTTALYTAMLDIPPLVWPVEATDWMIEFKETHDFDAVLQAVFDCEELTEDEWSSYHPVHDGPGTRPLSHDPVRGDGGDYRSRDTAEIPRQAGPF